MTDLDTRRMETLARLAASRAEIRRWLEPPSKSTLDADGNKEGDGQAGFPRSRTMKLLMTGRGAGTLGAMIAGLVVAKPALALRLLRMLPTGAVARMLLVKGISSMRKSK